VACKFVVVRSFTEDGLVLIFHIIVVPPGCPVAQSDKPSNELARDLVTGVTHQLDHVSGTPFLYAKE